MSSIASHGQSASRSLSSVSSRTRQPWALHSRMKAWPFSYVEMHRTVSGPASDTACSLEYAHEGGYHGGIQSGLRDSGFGTQGFGGCATCRAWRHGDSRIRWMVWRALASTDYVRQRFDTRLRPPACTSATSASLAGVHSPELGNTRDVQVYLPPSYATSGRHYPVIYMHDGQNLFDVTTAFAGEWRVDDTFERIGREGVEAIVVGDSQHGRPSAWTSTARFADPRRGGGRGRRVPRLHRAHAEARGRRPVPDARRAHAHRHHGVVAGRPDQPLRLLPAPRASSGSRA